MMVAKEDEFKKRAGAETSHNTGYILRSQSLAGPGGKFSSSLRRVLFTLPVIQADA